MLQLNLTLNINLTEGQLVLHKFRSLNTNTTDHPPSSASGCSSNHQTGFQIKMMDYDSYDVYERNSPVDCQDEAGLARERSRRMDRERREREDELQWEQDRNRDRNYGSKSFEDAHFAEGRGYREGSGVKYEDASFDGGDDYWEPASAGKTFDYNHGMSSAPQIASKQKADLARREMSRRHEDNLNAGPHRDPRPSITREIKDEPSTSIFLGGIPRTLDERDLESELIRCGLRARDIRIIRSKETGANRGFAFVDFHSVPDAQRWMELNQVYDRLLLV